MGLNINFFGGIRLEQPCCQVPQNCLQTLSAVSLPLTGLFLFLATNQEIEICLDLKYNRPHIPDIVRTRSGVRLSRFLKFFGPPLRIYLMLQELWSAFFDIVKDWYTVLQSGLITMNTEQQFIMIGIYETYMFQLGESEEYGAVQASPNILRLATLTYFLF
jgi:hypothetical protein